MDAERTKHLHQGRRSKGVRFAVLGRSHHDGMTSNNRKLGSSGGEKKYSTESANKIL